MYLVARTPVSFPARRIAQRSGLGFTLDAGSVATLLVGAVVGAVVYAALYGKRTNGTVSRESYNHVVDQLYRESRARDYEVEKGLSRDEALEAAEHDLEEEIAAEAEG